MYNWKSKYGGLTVSDRLKELADEYKRWSFVDCIGSYSGKSIRSTIKKRSDCTENESIDLVVSVESAFHYRTREDFFKEAFRVLRRGGRLVTADILPTTNSGNPFRRIEQWLSWNLVAGKFNIPEENYYLIPSYSNKLSKAGFVHIDIKSIRDDVYVPLHEYLSRNRTFLGKMHTLAKILAQLTLNRSAESVYAGLDYILSYSEKP
jgi:SAM-dependent methyltransferase